MEGNTVSNNKFCATGKILDGRYRLIRLLSDDGSSFTIWLARDIETADKNAPANDESSGKMVRVVVCHPTTALDIEDEQRWQDEFDAANGCHHPCLLPPEEYSVVNDTYYLVFPSDETGTLSQYIGKSISERIVWKIVLDLASGLKELHDCQPQIIHNDVQPSNILVIGNDFVLTNYGIHFEDDSQRIGNHKACVAYMAPERFQGNSIPHPENDIWAFGAILYEILTGSKPFGEQGGKNQRQDTLIPPLPNQPAELVDLICSCMQADPRKRPTAQQIMDLARFKRPSNKQKKTNQNEQREKPLDKDNRRKKVFAISAVVLLLLGIVVFMLKSNHHDEEPIDKNEVATVVNRYEEAVSLLSEKKTARIGREILDSLASAKDWQAVFLLSRLYFDTRGNDTVLYNKHWEMMRDNCGIIPNNEIAHNFLFDAFELNDNDYMILYQLGCDFKAGAIRGCERNLSFALWCFDTAESTLNDFNSDNAKRRKELEVGRERIPTSVYSPVKPFR